jgi:hypothetical protein
MHYKQRPQLLILKEKFVSHSLSVTTLQNLFSRKPLILNLDVGCQHVFRVYQIKTKS